MKKHQLIQALVEHIEAMGEDPHICLQTKVADCPGIPVELANKNGHIVLNISDRATSHSLLIEESFMSANMSFQGTPRLCQWHVAAVEMVHGRENAPRLLFPPPKVEEVEVSTEEKKPTLRIVK